MAVNRDKDRFNVIYSLVYPAILGTGLLGLFGQLVFPLGSTGGFFDHIKHPQHHVAIFLLGVAFAVIYIGSFVRSLRLPGTDTLGRTTYEKYTPNLFALDVLECVLMALGFGFINLIVLFNQYSPSEGALVQSLICSHGMLTLSLSFSWVWVKEHTGRYEWQAAPGRSPVKARTCFALRVFAVIIGGLFFLQWPAWLVSNLWLVPALILLAAIIYYKLVERD